MTLRGIKWVYKMDGWKAQRHKYVAGFCIYSIVDVFKKKKKIKYISGTFPFFGPIMVQVQNTGRTANKT